MRAADHNTNFISMQRKKKKLNNAAQQQNQCPNTDGFVLYLRLTTLSPNRAAKAATTIDKQTNFPILESGRADFTDRF